MKTKHSQQFAALPVRIVAGTTEVMLITSRQTRRWVIPKGWPIEGLSPRQVDNAGARFPSGRLWSQRSGCSVTGRLRASVDHGLGVLDPPGAARDSDA